ncbi:efflux RND transporter periplasmic adaptor subunit [Colwellia sp. RE-S-Sl-9]
MQIMNKKSLATVAGLACIFLAMGINSTLSANQQRTPPPKAAPQYPVVSVTQVSPVTHHTSVKAYGEVKSRNELTLTSQVSGRITYLSEKFLTGNTFKKGEVLAEVDSIVYQQALATAQVNLANAELALAQEQLNSSQAAQEWQQSGLANEKASDLVLRKPQLAAAKAQHVMASKALAKAEYDLAQTKFVAPFDALVVSKQVQVGSNVQVGNAIADLYDISLFEVSLPLSQQQWQLLPKGTNEKNGLSTIKVNLTDENSHEQWQAKFDRFEQHIDGASRQRSLVVVVENPIALANPLFPGSFIKASIQGKVIDKLWKLPASALIDNQTVWQVNNEGLLSHLAVNVSFSEGNAVYVQPINPIVQANIVNRPLSSYLVNMKVEAKVEELQ